MTPERRQFDRRNRSAHKDGARLTPTQMEVLDMFGSGLTCRKIADLLFTTRSTINWHLKCCRETYSVETSNAAVVEATRNDDIECPICKRRRV